jgi:capsular polysaccharide biosynthesis protein
MTTSSVHRPRDTTGRGRKAAAVFARRFLPGLFIVVLVSALAAAYANSSPKRYTGQAVLVVPAATAGALPPGNPDGAVKLAKTMATLLPANHALIDQVSNKVGLSADEIVKHLTVTNDASTAILRLNYTGTTPAVTAGVLNAIAAAVTSANPPGPIDAGALKVAQLPTSVTPSGHDARTALPIGIAAGVVLALLAAIGLERANPRIDSPMELAEATGAPVTSWEAVTPGGVSALVARWVSMVDLPQPDIALVGVGRVRRDLLLGVADEIETLSKRGRTPVSHGSDRRDRSSESEQRSGVTLRIADMSDAEASGDDIVQVSDLAVIVVHAGVKASAVFAMLRRLENYGVTPRWAIMARAGDLHAVHQRPVATAPIR